MGIVEYFGNLLVLGDAVITSNVSTSVGGLNNNEKSFCLYPNPCNGQITIQTDFHGKEEFVIMDITGKEVHVISTGQNAAHHVDVSFLSKGIYLIKHSGTSKSLLFVKE